MSRIVWGVFVDTTSYQTCMSIVTVMGAALIWCLPLLELIGTDLLFLGAVVAMFTCIGGTYSLFPYITYKCFGKTNFGVVYGVLQCALVSPHPPSSS